VADNSTVPAYATMI